MNVALAGPEAGGGSSCMSAAFCVHEMHNANAAVHARPRVTTWTAASLEQLLLDNTLLDNPVELLWTDMIKLFFGRPRTISHNAPTSKGSRRTGMPSLGSARQRRSCRTFADTTRPDVYRDSGR